MSMTPRPILPWRHQNAKIKKLESKDLPPVKYQKLDRDGQEVLVGRMKIPTPTGHAFILRRFDTGAISLTTMYRAAFPGASEVDEKKETSWVKENYDLMGNNGSSKEPNIVRLAGTWIDTKLAVEFADTYQLGDVIAIMASAEPDPNASYRRSSKAQTPKGKEPAVLAPSQQPQQQQLPTPSPSMATPSAPKRRKESSPAPSPSAATKAATPPPRRSARIKSPQPETMPSIASVVSPKSVKKPRRTVAATTTITPAAATGFSDDTLVDEDAEIAAMAGPDMKTDVEEQKELISKLKAERELASASSLPTVEEETKVKRPREDEDAPLTFNFKEPEVGERAIATNRRVGRFHLEPRTKSVAWGALAFAVGLGAVSFLPNFL